MLATAVDTLRDLGVPGIIGAIVGALIAHLTAKARGREDHERTLDLIVVQDERRSAQSALDAVRQQQRQVNLGSVQSSSLLHNDFSARVTAPSRQIRNDELHRRVSAAGYVMFASESYVTYAVLRGLLDVEEWLEYWLRREPPPPAHLPQMAEMQELIRLENGRISFAALNLVLQARA